MFAVKDHRVAPLANQALTKQEAPSVQPPPRKKKKRKREDDSATPAGGGGSGADLAAAWATPRQELGSTAPQPLKKKKKKNKKNKSSGSGGLQDVPVAMGSAQAHGSGDGGGKGCSSSRDAQSSSREPQRKPAKTGDMHARSQTKVAPVAVGMDGIDDILAMMGGSTRRPEPEPEPEPAEELAAPDTDAALPPLDSAHRVAGPSGVDFRFRCAALRMDAAELAALGDDCRLIFEKQQGSNWLPATATPRCALERLALAVFEQHSAGATFDRARSGAEWWPQVRDGGRKQEAIEFHWDVDEHLCDGEGRGGVHVHPTLSTVTYLTAVG